MQIRTRVGNAIRIAKRDGISALALRIWLKIVGKIYRISIVAKRSIIRKTNTSKILSIAFYPTGGLGDYIISAKILEELLLMCNCNINVYCEKCEFGLAIYGNRDRVCVKPFSKFETERYECDLALTVEHFIHIKNIEWKRIKLLSSELYKRMLYLKKNWNQLYVDIPQQHYREMVHFKKCYLNGLNRWTELRMGKAFDVENQKVTIPLLNDYEDIYKNLDFYGRKYVTMNCGTDAMRSTGTQTKTWFNSYYEELATLIKGINPNINIVQLGAADGTVLNGMDYHIMGQSIELTKWILKNSILHVDIEGGLVHMATQLGTKCAVIFGPTPMNMYAYPQNENICNGKCFGCMGIDENWAYKCFRGYDRPLCMNEITPDVVFERIKKYIEV